jgi:predicted transcriptional regulator
MIEIESLEAVSIKIRNLRKSTGISQQALAKRIGISQSAVARLENDIGGMNPSYALIFKVVDELNRLEMEEGSAGLLNRTAESIMHRKIIAAGPKDSVAKAIKLFKYYDFPQLPVIDKDGYVVGALYQQKVLEIASRDPSRIGRILVEEVADTALPQVSKDTKISKIKPILENWGAVIVMDKGHAVGIITSYDVLKLL